VNYWSSVHNPGSASGVAHEVQKQCQHHFASIKHTSEFLGPGWWHVFLLHTLMSACRFIIVHSRFIACDNPWQESYSFFIILQQKLHISMHACLCSSVNDFGTNLAQILWYLRSSWMMEYVDPHLMSNLSAMSVIVICMFSWNRALTHSTMSTVHDVVRQPEWFSSMILVVTMETFHPLVHLLLHNTVFFVLC
jgi:hypothetical protein